MLYYHTVNFTWLAPVSSPPCTVRGDAVSFVSADTFAIPLPKKKQCLTTQLLAKTITIFVQPLVGIGTTTGVKWRHANFQWQFRALSTVENR